MFNITPEKIHEPFRSDKYEILQKGISDNPEVDVYINSQKDFAFLYPQPVLDYTDYLPRVKKLNLENYKKKKSVYEDRFNKISPFLKNNISSLLEIGAAAGSFLEIIKRETPDIKLAAVEPDTNTASLREKFVGTESYANLDEICSSNRKYDVICFFHVLEHIVDPSSFFLKLRQLMHSDTLIIIEVPSLFDPLLSLYNCASYKRFYFQTQHPYVYSRPSITRLMKYNNFKAAEIIDFQRYGLENHLNWLINDVPGGNELFRGIFSATGKNYITELENYGKTDSVIWIGKSGS